MTPGNDSLHALFATPVQFVHDLMSPHECGLLSQLLRHQTSVGNDRSSCLSHTALLEPGQHPGIDALARQLLPRISQFGALLLGETRPWSIKEMWGNVMQHGGHQSLHNHANCLISGIVYLTATEGCTQTAFVKSMGGLDFKLSNENARTQATAFNAQRWQAPHASAGSAILFPSYLLHEVPPNQGTERITLAFNAIPDRIDSWGYSLSFGA